MKSQSLLNESSIYSKSEDNDNEHAETAANKPFTQEAIMEEKVDVEEPFVIEHFRTLFNFIPF